MKTILCLFLAAFGVFALDDMDFNNTYVDSSILTAAELNEDNDSTRLPYNRLLDTIDTKFVRFSDFNDSTIDTLNISAIRGNPDVDSLAGAIVLDTVLGVHADTLYGIPNLFLSADSTLIITNAIAIGTNNTIDANYSGILSGKQNYINDRWSVVAGGSDDSIKTSENSFIGSGSSNMLEFGSHLSGIVCGDDNGIFNSVKSFIGAGGKNYVSYSDFSGIVCGYSDTISSKDNSVILGGALNKITGYNSLVFGLKQKVSGDSSIAFGFNGDSVTAGNNLFRVNMDSMRIDGNLNVLGKLAIDTISTDLLGQGKVVVDDSLRVEGRIQQSSGDSLIAGDLRTLGNLDVGGNFSISGDFTVPGVLTVDTIDSGLTVMGKVVVDDSLRVGGRIQQGSGDSLIAGYIRVDGSINSGQIRGTSGANGDMVDVIGGLRTDSIICDSYLRQTGSSDSALLGDVRSTSLQATSITATSITATSTLNASNSFNALGLVSLESQSTIYDAKVFGFRLSEDWAQYTISSNAITVHDTSYIALMTEGAASLDTVSSITSGTYTQEGNVLVLRSVDDAYDVLFLDSGTLHLSGNFTLSSRYDRLVLMHVGSNTWVEISRSDND